VKYLHGHGPRSPAELLLEAAHWCRDHDVGFDQYGTGEVLERLQQAVAERLGFPAGRFFVSGTMAQNVALKVYAERAGRPHVGMHPTSHLELHEERAYARLWGLDATLVGPAEVPLRADHLQRVVEPLAALLVELPIREAGGQLPSWEELEALKGAAASRQLPLHLDGARLWGCGPAYGRSYAEICAGFSSVYVSFYKAVGGLSGAMLLGDEAFLAEAAVWQRRAGGTLWSQIPMVASAAARWEQAIERSGDWVAHARTLAAVLADVPGLRVHPDPPHTNLFHLHGEWSAMAVVHAREKVSEELGIRPVGSPRPGALPGTFRCEVMVAEAAMQISPQELARAWERMVELLSSEPPASA